MVFVMPFENDMFMHNLYEQKLKRDFHNDKRSPEQIQELFGALGYENVSQTILNRLSKLSNIEGLNLQKRNSHFQDAVEISEIIDNLVEDIEMDESEMNELRFACLVHDVGKSGPAEATPEEQQAFVDVFNLDFNQIIYTVNNHEVTPQELTLQQALQIKVDEGDLTEERADEILTRIVSAGKKQQEKRFETKIGKKIRMGLLWSAHVYWSYDILRDQGVDNRVVEVAASHHMIDGHDPARVGIENVDPQMASLELADKYQAFRVRLVIADKYQAFRIRGTKTHEQTIEILRSLVEERLSDQEKVKQLYLAAVGELDKHKDIFEQELELKN